MEININGFLDWLAKRVNATGAQYFVFGIFGLVNYPGSYFFWHNVIVQEYNPLSLRIIAAALCVPLILHKQWPRILQQFLPLYWYITVLYCLPFFGSYTLFMNHISNAWLMNMVLGIFLFILLVDWLMFILLLSIGCALGWLAFALHHGELQGFSTQTLALAIYMYIFAIAIGVFFSRSKEKLAEEKIKAAILLAGSIAHELRTPLATIKVGAGGVQKYLPTLLQTYQRAHEEKISDIPFIRPVQFNSLQHSLTNIGKEADSLNLVINMLLTNLGSSEIDRSKFSVYSITECVNHALERYPIAKDMRTLLQWQDNLDFQFYGSDILTVHMIFNLLKNALYYIKAANKGELFIWLEITARKNKLHFKDTGTGIAASELSNLFKQFHSKKSHGTGIGLAFCKTVMRSYDGDIVCYSHEGEFTEFVLSFPKCKQKQIDSPLTED